MIRAVAARCTLAVLCGWRIMVVATGVVAVRATGSCCLTVAALLVSSISRRLLAVLCR